MFDAIALRGFRELQLSADLVYWSDMKRDAASTKYAIQGLRKRKKQLGSPQFSNCDEREVLVSLLRKLIRLADNELELLEGKFDELKSKALVTDYGRNPVAFESGDWLNTGDGAPERGNRTHRTSD